MKLFLFIISFVICIAAGYEWGAMESFDKSIAPADQVLAKLGSCEKDKKFLKGLLNGH